MLCTMATDWNGKKRDIERRPKTIKLFKLFVYFDVRIFCASFFSLLLFIFLHILESPTKLTLKNFTNVHRSIIYIYREKHYIDINTHIHSPHMGEYWGVFHFSSGPRQWNSTASNKY